MNENDNHFLNRYLQSNQKYYYPVLILLIAAYLLFIGIPTIHAKNKFNILVLHSYHHGFEWTDQIMAGIGSVFNKSDIDADLFIEYMDTKFYKPEILFPLLQKIYAVKYHKRQPDIIISSDNNALDFLLSSRDLLFPGVPIVFCGINNYSDSLIENQADITGVAEDFSFKETIDLALRLHPGTRQIAIISDSTHTSHINLERMKLLFPDFSHRVSFIELTGLTTQAFKENLHHLLDDSIVINNGLFRDANGQKFTIKEGLDFVVQNTTVPVYTLWKFLIHQGVLGGIVVNGFSQGEQAALMAEKILQGKSPDHIPVLKKSPNVPVFDYNAMVRFKINKANLPEGSIILNIPSSFYARNKNVVWIILVIVSALVFIIFMLGSNIKIRKEAEDNLKEHQEHLEVQVQKRTAELERHITGQKQAEEKIKASLQEKEVLLKEIHHRVKNNMQVIASLLQLQAASINDEKITQALMDCQGRVQTMAFAHEILYSSDRLAAIDFKTYVSRLTDKIYQTYHFTERVKLAVDAEDINLGIEQATPLGLIIHELVSNSLKYAFPENRSGKISIKFQRIEKDMSKLVFRDNGTGLPRDLDWRNTDSLGLQLVVLLAENQLDGTIDLDRNNGTQFIIKFMLKKIG